MTDWELFVLSYGWRASAYELAAVVAQPQAEIEKLRRTRVCSRLDRPKTYTELFSLWFGREPSNDEWPKPRKLEAKGTYEWQPPEMALLASLVGQISQMEIAEVLTARLREVTGDPQAERSRNAVQVRTNVMGLQTTDIVGGLTTAQAGREVGSLALVNQMISAGTIPTRRVGRLHVIPREAWNAWKATRVFPPEGYVQLASIREALSIRSDKLSEYARMGLIPTAVRCNPYGTKGGNTQFGTWWIAPETAEQLLSDRRAGRHMPWHGRYVDNLKTTFKLWEKRKHPASCATCAEIWGEQGVPQDFSSYALRYPPLAHGAKRHLTRPWTPGLTIEELVTHTGKSAAEVQQAIDSGTLAATRYDEVPHVSRTDATRWVARGCPSGAGDRSWIALQTACDSYYFSKRELNRHIGAGTLKVRPDPKTGEATVSRQQCAQLRETIGFTEDQAARRLGITVERFRHLVDGVDWRTAGSIPLATVQAVRKRLESRHGYTIQEAAAELGQTEQWVKEQIEKGATKVSRAMFDQRRLYLSEPMLNRLRRVVETPVENTTLGGEWLTLGEAALEAAVCLATLNSWGLKGELSYREHKGYRYYHREAVRARARRYWANPRRHRTTPPEWLRREASTQNYEVEHDSV